MARKGRGKRPSPPDSSRHNNYNFNRTAAARTASVGFSPPRNQSIPRTGRNRNHRSLSIPLPPRSSASNSFNPPKRPRGFPSFTSHHSNLDSDGDQVMHRSDEVRKRTLPPPSYTQPRHNSTPTVPAAPRTSESTNSQIAGIYKTTLNALRTPRQALALALPPCHHCAEIAGTTSHLRAVMASLSTAQHQALDMWETGMAESVQCCEQARVVALAHVECLVRGLCACGLGFDPEVMDWQPEPVIPVRMAAVDAQDTARYSTVDIM